MALTRSVLVTTPVVRQEEVDSVWLARIQGDKRPFKLQVGNIDVMLSYAELSKLMADADGEIRDYLGEEHV
jgi:hypothetical protein